MVQMVKYCGIGKSMISFVLNFCSIEKNRYLNISSSWLPNNYFKMVSTTIKIIRNIQKHNFKNHDYEIILVDNSHNWPDIDLPNVRVVKGFQGYSVEDLQTNELFRKHKDVVDAYHMDLSNETMWVSLGYYRGIAETKGEFVICQHNDLFYYNFEAIENMIEDMDLDGLSYISVDNKKVGLVSYILHQELFETFLKDSTNKIIPLHGGMLETKDIGFADCYFFLCRKSFFDNYDVDWVYGDSNHGATIYCMQNGLNYLHLGPYYDNPSYDTQDTDGHNVYYYDGKPFASHMKGGFTENKMSSETNKDFYEKLDDTI